MYKRIANSKYNQKENEVLEKQRDIEDLKRVSLGLKNNLDKLRNICKTKVEAIDLVNQEENKTKEAEFRSLFDHLKELFNQEIEEKLKETKDKLKQMKHEKEELKQLINESRRIKRTPQKKKKGSKNKKRTGKKKKK